MKKPRELSQRVNEESRSSTLIAVVHTRRPH